MADITMCPGNECSRKDMCYRYTATHNEWRQIQFIELPLKDGNCIHFYDNTGYFNYKLKQNELQHN
jgi:hypothetical protein